MARDHPVRDGGSNGRRRRGLDRRSVLKLTGAMAGSVVATTAASANNDYRVIEARGQTVSVGSGETFENVLFDLTTGHGVTLITRNSTNWTVRNVGFKGYNEGPGMRVGLSDSGGGTSLVENFYMGDGSAKSVESFQHGPGAIFLGPEHNGHLTFRNCNVQGYPNNGFYCSNASPGTVRFENCFAKNNGVANFRIDRGEIRNCVAYNDNTNYGWDGGYSEENGRPTWFWPEGPIHIYDSHFSGQNWTLNRALIAGANYGASDVTMHSGAFEGRVHEANGSIIRVNSTVRRSDPDLSVPDGCPTSAEEAASGGSSSGDDGDDVDDGYRFLYELVAEGEDEPTDYYIEVEDGPIVPSERNGAVVEDDYIWMSDDGRRVAGRVVDGRHAWEFDELLVDVTVEGPATALVDGRLSDLDRYPLDGATGDDWKGDMPWHDDDQVDDGEGDEEEDDHEYRFLYELVAEGEDEPSDYYIEVEDGPIVPSTRNGAVVEDDYMWMSDDGRRVAGRVVDGRHAWEFDELLVDVTVEGPADALVDERPSDLDRYPLEGATGDDWKGDMPWHDHEYRFLYELVAEGEDEPTDYYIEVEDGPIVPSERNGAVIEDDYMWKSDDGRRVAGRVVDGRHAWEFDELLVDVTVDGPAEALVDERESNLGRYPLDGATGDDWKGGMPWHDEHTLVIDGVGQLGSTDYEFQVSGEVAESDADGAFPDDGDRIDGGHVTGSVSGWRDAYVFTGDLETLRVDGRATVTLDGEVIDPNDFGPVTSHVLTIIASSDPVDFTIVVDGHLESIGYDGGNGAVVGGTAEGTLERSFRRYRLAGEIESIDLDGPGWVYLDGSALDPDDY